MNLKDIDLAKKEIRTAIEMCYDEYKKNPTPDEGVLAIASRLKGVLLYLTM